MKLIKRPEIASGLFAYGGAERSCALAALYVEWRLAAVRFNLSASSCIQTASWLSSSGYLARLLFLLLP